MSALSRTAPQIGECRVIPSAACGRSSAVHSICARKSGDAPSRNHERESALIATCVCVRALPGNVPARSERQLGQAQFHWGKPPPAAEPRILTCMKGSVAAEVGFLFWEYYWLVTPTPLLA